MLAGLKYAEAPGPSLQQSSSQVGTDLVGNWGSPGQGSSTDGPQQTHQQFPAALGAALQMDKNASFGESSTTVGQQLTTDSVCQYDNEPLSDDCARPLSDKSLQNNSGSASVALTKVSKKRAAEVSSAEPAAKHGSCGGQGSTAAGGALQQMGEGTADVGGDGNSTMAGGGESNRKGRRRFSKLRKKSITMAVEHQGDHGGEEVQAVARY